MPNIVIGITGGIAAYKIPDCIRQFAKLGYEVRVVMTQSANEFVTPSTLEAVSGHAVYQHLWDQDAMLHIELARWADLILIAPATANFMASLAHGIADDLLSTICITTTAPIMVAPAMNREMWANAATQDNIKTLASRDVSMIGPAEGKQACGEVGIGRMVEPVGIVDQVVEFMASFNQSLAGKHILITAGPTREPIDSIRFMSNRSSGQMGYALAAVAHSSGAEVTLISGPTALIPPNVTVVPVTTAEEMYQAVMTRIDACDVFISAAAVADYTPKHVASSKLKKKPGDLVLELERTQDILAAVGALEAKPYCIGFAAEDEQLIESAQQKLQTKNVDLIVANLISDGFEKATNQAVLVANDSVKKLEAMSKLALARTILATLHVPE
ncbi:MAG: bifunctional phosphopantothenoylcysteine decarboxylase/phosphopantothenate--cysteine ligase CoaBC [Coxiella sp. (in: Bacteria)]|nr:MAG: bifunctional phosphopantothenoylcysteine decarboxylase/phosphopantothenate--cysteine ligase CoaBC [Coxiella sp. (in: g-proteobacteria)]